MYGVIRNLLFRLPAEQAHNVALNGLDLAHRLGVLSAFSPKIDSLPVNVMGLDFPNPVGLAAGLDKNADHLDALGALGFGFIEVGTVTPLAQPGNPKPRMFRLQEHQAIINRMGFNNQGLDHLLARVDQRRYKGVLGINVGKNKDTPNEQSESDYRKGISAVYSRADYITVNVSSPNTPGLRDLQFGDSLKGLLEAIKGKYARRRGEGDAKAAREKKYKEMQEQARKETERRIQEKAKKRDNAFNEMYQRVAAGMEMKVGITKEVDDALVEREASKEKKKRELYGTWKEEVYDKIHNQIDAVQTECNYFAERCDKNFSRYKQLIRAYYEKYEVEYYPERGADWFPDWGSGEVQYDPPEPGSYCNSRHDSNEGW